MLLPTILALDFDGVLCDGLIEYFQTSWRAYCQLFDLPMTAPPDGLAEQFYPLRPVIETGWEMPLLLHALQQGVEAAAVLDDWPKLVQDLLKDTQINPDVAMAAVDGVRDRWIQTDLEGWLGLHRFYPGVIDRLQQAIAADIFPIVISTKEGRFIQSLLATAGVDLPREQIIGKEIKQPKTTTLKQLQASPPAAAIAPQPIWFVEDRLKTLDQVTAVSDLDTITLFLVDWGYNTAVERRRAAANPRIHLLSLSQMADEFTAWTNPS